MCVIGNVWWSMKDDKFVKLYSSITWIDIQTIIIWRNL